MKRKDKSFKPKDEANQKIYENDTEFFFVMDKIKKWHIQNVIKIKEKGNRTVIKGTK